MFQNDFTHRDDGQHSLRANVLDRADPVRDAVGNVLEAVGDDADGALCVGRACDRRDGEDELELHDDGCGGMSVDERLWLVWVRACGIDGYLQQAVWPYIDDISSYSGQLRGSPCRQHTCDWHAELSLWRWQPEKIGIVRYGGVEYLATLMSSEYPPMAASPSIIHQDALLSSRKPQRAPTSDHEKVSLEVSSFTAHAAATTRCPAGWPLPGGVHSSVDGTCPGAAASPMRRGENW